MPDLCNLDDAQRLDALDRYDILDTREEEAFDRITRLVRRFFGVDFATVTFIDGHRQWFKSRQGLANSEEARHAAFCQIPIFEGRPLVVPDTFLDPRFVENPLVLGPPHLRFYAGVPLRGSGKIHIGTLCAMHSAPRQFDDGELSVLIDLARMVEVGLHLRLVAMRDELTGALSRRAFREEAERAVALATRHKHELSCITFDLDHF